jgi:hypothetical protein
MEKTKKELLAAYSVLNSEYKAPRLMYVAGRIGNPVIAIDSPADSNLNIINSTVAQQDPVLFTYSVPNSYTGKRELRILLAKIFTSAGSSTANYSVIMPSEDGKSWFFRTRDVQFLKDPNTRVAGNPHGVVQLGETLYIIDYDARKIWTADVGALEGAADGGSVTVGEIDLSEGSDANLPNNAKGQAIIYLKNTTTNDEYLFALYLRNDTSGGGYQPSILVRLKKNASGTFEYDGKIEDDFEGLGFNAQEIIPVAGGSGGGVSLLIPAFGGMQNSDHTNGVASVINKVDPFASPFDIDALTTLVTGDSAAAAGTYDIAAIAAQAKTNGIVYILTFTFWDGYKELRWKLYKTTAGALLDLPQTTPPPTLSSLEFTGLPPSPPTSKILEIVDSGITESPTAYSTGLNFWDILYENDVDGPDGTDNGRLWFRRDGVQVDQADSYGNPQWFFGMGASFGQIGSQNINSFILPCEVERQIAAGFMGKHGFKIAAPHLKAAALKAARSAAGKPEAEEEEEK